MPCELYLLNSTALKTERVMYYYDKWNIFINLLSSRLSNWKCVSNKRYISKYLRKSGVERKSGHQCIPSWCSWCSEIRWRDDSRLVRVSEESFETTQLNEVKKTLICKDDHWSWSRLLSSAANHSVKFLERLTELVSSYSKKIRWAEPYFLIQKTAVIIFWVDFWVLILILSFL